MCFATHMEHILLVCNYIHHYFSSQKTLSGAGKTISLYRYIRGVTRKRLGSTSFNIFSSELNVNGYPFKKSNSFLNKGQLFKEKNLLLQSKFFTLRVDPI